MFIFAFIVIALGLLAFIIGLSLRSGDSASSNYDEERGFVGKVTRVVGGIITLVGVILLSFTTFFTQDVGQSSVLRDVTGNIVGFENTPGLHFKAPWVQTVTFDVRNQRMVFAGKTGEQSDNSGGEADGPQITIQDADGVSSNIDIAVRYSIKSDSVVDIYSDYQNEENLRSKLLFNDVRSIVRAVPGKFSTLELLTQRDDVQNAIREALEKEWADEGIIVDDVALQEIRVPKTVRESFAEAQRAEIDVAKETSKLEGVKVSAQQKIVQAQAEADANRLLTQSLTPEVLQQRYLDTLAKLAEAGNLVITDGSNAQVLVQK